MKTLLASILFILSIFIAQPSEAVTIKNKCSYPVAGSLRYEESNVMFAQFRLAPGQKVHLGKGISNTQLILRTIPDAGMDEAATITNTNLKTPDCYVELKSSDEGIKVSVD
ncbi:MAG: hypothetical protein BA863_12630 [Desulfovibrio sp. S3730MH75]|nr:MAG: hypothetical protein BA863_12630 [Desulfovibrio sp. S3730MH75]